MTKQENAFDLIRDWADKRGIYQSGDSKTQYIKLGEEFGELGKALLKRDDLEVYDAIGDMVVVLTNLTELYERERAHDTHINVEDCIGRAYEVIASRTGKMENGTFVKD